MISWSSELSQYPDTSSLPDQLCRNRNTSLKTHPGSQSHLHTSREIFNIKASDRDQMSRYTSSNISLRSPVEKSCRSMNTREKALISGVLNR